MSWRLTVATRQNPRRGLFPQEASPPMPSGLFRLAAVLSLGLAAAELWSTAVASRSVAEWRPLSPALDFGGEVGFYAGSEGAVTLLLFIGVASIAAAFNLWMLGRFLERSARFHGADRLILFLVAYFVVNAAITWGMRNDPMHLIYELPVPPSRPTLTYVSLSFWVRGVLLMALGFSMLRSPGPSFALTRLYAYALIATGAAYASSLGPWALIASVPSHVLLGMILWQAASPEADRGAWSRSVPAARVVGAGNAARRGQTLEIEIRARRLTKACASAKLKFLERGREYEDR